MARRERAYARGKGPPVTHLKATERSDTLASAIESLDERSREILRLRYEEDADFREIGRALGIPAETARTRHHRALGKLRGQLSRPGSSERRVWSLAGLLAFFRPKKMHAVVAIPVVLFVVGETLLSSRRTDLAFGHRSEDAPAAVSGGQELRRSFRVAASDVREADVLSVDLVPVVVRGSDRRPASGIELFAREHPWGEEVEVLVGKTNGQGLALIDRSAGWVFARHARLGSTAMSYLPLVVQADVRLGLPLLTEDVHGRVVDVSGRGIEGAGVLVDGFTDGTVTAQSDGSLIRSRPGLVVTTNAKGAFETARPSGSGSGEIVVSAAGYRTRRVDVGLNRSVEIELEVGEDAPEGMRRLQLQGADGERFKGYLVRVNRTNHRLVQPSISARGWDQGESDHLVDEAGFVDIPGDLPDEATLRAIPPGSEPRRVHAEALASELGATWVLKDLSLDRGAIRGSMHVDFAVYLRSDLLAAPIFIGDRPGPFHLKGIPSGAFEIVADCRFCALAGPSAFECPKGRLLDDLRIEAAKSRRIEFVIDPPPSLPWAVVYFPPATKPSFIKARLGVEPSPGRGHVDASGAGYLVVPEGQVGEVSVFAGGDLYAYSEIGVETRGPLELKLLHIPARRIHFQSPPSFEKAIPRLVGADGEVLWLRRAVAPSEITPLLFPMPDGPCSLEFTTIDGDVLAFDFDVQPGATEVTATNPRD